MDNQYLIRKLEESSGYYNFSFSNRYSNWKRYYSIKNALAKELKTKLLKGEINILDVGCGEGQLIYRLKATFSKKYNVNFFGIDISPFDIDFANKRKEHFGHKNCNFMRMDAGHVEFDDEKFDIIICSEVIEHIIEPEKVMEQIYRVLKKGGLGIITVPNKSGGLLAKFLRIIKRLSGIKEDNMIEFLSEEEASGARLSSDGGSTGAGHGHVSVKSIFEWKNIFKKIDFKIISSMGTGGLLFGCPQLDKHRILFAFTVIMDVIIEKFPFSYLWSETLLFELKK